LTGFFRNEEVLAAPDSPVDKGRLRSAGHDRHIPAYDRFEPLIDVPGKFGFTLGIKKSH
jgi:hypothetical protein